MVNVGPEGTVTRVLHHPWGHCPLRIRNTYTFEARIRRLWKVLVAEPRQPNGRTLGLVAPGRRRCRSCPGLSVAAAPVMLLESHSVHQALIRNHYVALKPSLSQCRRFAISA